MSTMDGDLAIEFVANILYYPNVLVNFFIFETSCIYLCNNQVVTCKAKVGTFYPLSKTIRHCF
jgi:hypothetical protein